MAIKFFLSLVLFLGISFSGLAKEYTRRIFGEKHELEQLKSSASKELYESSQECQGIYRAVPSKKWNCNTMQDYPHKFVCEVRYACIKHGVCMPGDRDVTGCVSEEVPENGIQYRKCLPDGTAWGEWGRCRLAHCSPGFVMFEGKCIPQEKAPKQENFEIERPEKPKKEKKDQYLSWKNFSASGISITNSQGSIITTDFAWTPTYIAGEAIFRLNIGGHLFKQLEGGNEAYYQVVDFALMTGKTFVYNIFAEVGLGMQWWIGADDKYFSLIGGVGYRFDKNIKIIDRVFVDFSGVLAFHFTYEIKIGVGFKF